jgi:hypothetical protein
MRFASGSNLGRVTFRRIVVPFTVVATMVALAIGGYYTFAPHTQAAGAPDYSARTGLIPQVGSATLAQSNAAVSSASTSNVIKGALAAQRPTPQRPAASDHPGAERRGCGARQPKRWQVAHEL